MKAIILFLSLTTGLWAHAQQFSLPLIFEDTDGNKDSIIIGFDPAATNGIDPGFGEADSVGLHWQDDFEVWIIDAGPITGNAGNPTFTPAYHTKRQIVPASCNFTQTIKIGIKFAQPLGFPYKIYWDSTTFEDACLNGSLFTTFSPIGFDYPIDLSWDFMSRIPTGNTGAISGGANILYQFPPNWFEQDGEDISALFITLSDTASLPEVSDVGTDNEHIIPLFIYPNPTTSLLNVKIPFQSASETTIMISSMSGQMVDIRDVQPFTQQISIDVSGLPSGMYLLAYSFDGASKVTTFIKD